MGPGVWNGNLYTSEEIIKAFKNTNWNDKEVRALFFDHEDKRLSKQAGMVENPKLVGDKVLGDLYLYDKDAIIKVGLAKYRCGISPKVGGQEDSNRKMSDFKYLNFSIVTNPACKKAFINMSEQSTQVLSQINIQLSTEDTSKEVNLGDDSKNYIGGCKKMIEEDKSTIENKELKPVEAKPVETEVAKPEIDSAPKVEELSDSAITEMLSTMSVEELSEYSAFTAKMKTKSPEVKFKEIVMAFKKEKEMFVELSKLDKDELSARIEFMTKILRQKFPDAPMVQNEKKMSEEVENLRSKVKELEDKMNVPDRKTVKSLSSTEMPKSNLNGTQAMFQYLSNLR